MDTAPLKEIFEELFSSLEHLEAQSTAALEFLKAEKRGSDKKLEPILQQAAEASNVRWRAARLRIERLLSEIERQEEKAEAQKKEAEQIERQQERAGAQKKEAERPEPPAQPQTAPQTQSATASDKRAVPDQKDQKDQKKEGSTSAQAADGTPAKSGPAEARPKPAQPSTAQTEEHTSSTATKQEGDRTGPPKQLDKTSKDAA